MKEKLRGIKQSKGKGMKTWKQFLKTYVNVNLYSRKLLLLNQK